MKSIEQNSPTWGARIFAYACIAVASVCCTATTYFILWGLAQGCMFLFAVLTD